MNVQSRWTATDIPDQTGRTAVVTGANGASGSSSAHHMGRPVDPGNPFLHGRYDPWRAHGQSKLATFHFALGLHERCAGAASLLAHPGLSNTELQAVSVRDTGGWRSQRFF